MRVINTLWKSRVYPVLTKLSRLYSDKKVWKDYFRREILSSSVRKAAKFFKHPYFAGERLKIRISASVTYKASVTIEQQ